MQRHALLDGDVLVYGTGFAADASAKLRYKEAHGGLEGFDIKEHHEPVENALHLTKQKIQNILARVGANEYTVYISHPVNYREGFFPDYKMNRDITHKPFWYNEVREYLLDRHAALYSEEGDEADDALGIRQMEMLWDDDGPAPVIVSIDKDLNMIPGLHYNFSKNNEAKGVYEMEDPEGLRLFYTQIITGDTSDNIPGLYKKRGIRADAKWAMPMETMTNARQMYDYVVNEVFEGDKAHVDLMGKILWIKRDSNWWEPPQ